MEFKKYNHLEEEKKFLTFGLKKVALNLEKANGIV
jgi:hypothetical protein